MGASTTPDLDGNNRVLSGSDIFVPVARQILANTPLAVPGPTSPDSSGNSSDGTYYIGGGQSVGDAAIQANTQQISVGTASLKNSNYCKNAATGTAVGSIGWVDADGNSATSGANTGAGAGGKELDIQGTTEALLIGLDGLSILGSTAQAVTGNSVAVGGAGKTITVRHYVESPAGSKNFVVDPTTDPTTAYGAVLNGDHTATYTINNSLDVVRLLYGGLHHGTLTTVNSAGELGTFNCGSDVRRSLADSWGTIFTGNTPSPTGQLNHIWRRSDLAGATNAFIALVNFGVRGIGALTGSSTKTSPFCNSGDANGLNANTGVAIAGQSQVDSTAKSNGGPGDFADFDPIRRPALVGLDPSSTSLVPKDLEQVASNDGKLGLVLPVFPPDTPGIALTQSYATRACSAGKFDLIATGFTPGPTAPCPQGGPFLGLCYQPYFQLNAADTHHYNCVAKSNASAFGAPSPADGRSFNLAVKDDTDGHYIKDLNNRFLARAGFYRIHTTVSNTLVTAGVPSSGLVTAKEPLANKQEAALVGAEPFSLSFNGRGDDADPLLGGRVTALGLSGQSPAYDPTLAVFPTDQHVKNLVIPVASRPPSDTVVYPLARRIYVNTLVGFSASPGYNDANPALSPTAADGGPAVRGLRGQELALARAFQNSNHVGAAFLNFGFVPLPSAAEGYAPNGVSALDYPEDGAVTSPNLTTTPLNGCGQPAGQNRDATVASPPDSITPYSLSGSSPPFPPWP